LHQVCQGQELRDPSPALAGRGRTNPGFYFIHSYRPGEGQLGAGPIGQLDQVAQAGIRRVSSQAQHFYRLVI
jgi:hypothetical protein